MQVCGYNTQFLVYPRSTSWCN